MQLKFNNKHHIEVRKLMVKKGLALKKGAGDKNTIKKRKKEVEDLNKRINYLIDLGNKE